MIHRDEQRSIGLLRMRLPISRRRRQLRTFFFHSNTRYTSELSCYCNMIAAPNLLLSAISVPSTNFAVVACKQLTKSFHHTNTTRVLCAYTITNPHSYLHQHLRIMSDSLPSIQVIEITSSPATMNTEAPITSRSSRSAGSNSPLRMKPYSLTPKSLKRSRSRMSETMHPLSPAALRSVVSKPQLSSRKSLGGLDFSSSSTTEAAST